MIVGLVASRGAQVRALELLRRAAEKETLQAGSVSGPRLLSSSTDASGHPSVCSAVSGFELRHPKRHRFDDGGAERPTSAKTSRGLAILSLKGQFSSPHAPPPNWQMVANNAPQKNRQPVGNF